MSLNYSPVPSTEEFFTSDKPISLICGPIGSTKTTAGIVKILYHAGRMAKATDGLRYSRCIWVRQSREQLRDTSIPDFLRWFPDGQAGSFLKSEMKFVLSVGDIRCEVLFRGLDDSADVRRLLSLQASFAVVEEFRELNKDVYEALQGRLGRYPDGMLVPHKPEWGVDEKGNPRQGCVMDNGMPNSRLWGMSNPPDMDTFFEEILSNPPSTVHVTIQPSGTSPEADWVHLLPSGYYETLAVGKSEAYTDVYIHAKFGKSLSGQPVFKSFEGGFHIAKTPLRPILNGMRPIIIGMDFGLNPSAAICQLDMRGRLLVLGEATSDGMGVLRFLRTILRPMLAQSFPGAPILVIGDPAGVQRVQTDEQTVYHILKAEGFKAIPAYTNSLVARIGAVDEFLNRQVDGTAGFLIDQSCLGLIGGLRGKYRYKIAKNGETNDEPEKNHASHLCFVANTAIETPSGPRPVQSLVVGDWVTTPIGKRRVTHTGVRTAEVVRAEFSDGTCLVGTPEHPVLTQRGWVALDALQYADILESLSNKGSSWLRNIQFRFSTVFGFIANIRGTSKQGLKNQAVKRSTCTDTSGSFTTARYLQSIMSTIRTKTVATMPSTTLSLCSALTIAGITYKSVSPMELWIGNRILRKPESPLLCGTALQQDLLGTLPTEKHRGKIDTLCTWIACIAGTALAYCAELPRKGFAPLLARAPHAVPAVSITRLARAWFAEQSSRQINTRKLKPASKCVRVVKCSEIEPVYALSVEGAGVYYANSLLVSNCDALQYACLHADAQQSGKHISRHRKVQSVNMSGWT